MSTPARVKLAYQLPAAIREGWTTQRLADTAGVSYATAHRYLVRFKDSVIQTARDTVMESTSKLHKEAQEAQAAALAHLRELRGLMDVALEHVKAAAPADGKPGRPVEVDDFGQPVPFNPGEFAKSVKTVQQTARDLKKFADEVTGVDVVKAITIKTHSDKEGKLVSWSGVDALHEAIEAEIVRDIPKLLELKPSPAEDRDFWSGV